jgi:hypothetical protein
MLKTFELTIARDGETFAEDFLAENRDCAELDIVVRINEVWSTDYATFDDLTADCDGYDLIEHPAVMAQRIPLATMELYRSLAEQVLTIVEDYRESGSAIEQEGYDALRATVEALGFADPAGEPGTTAPILPDVTIKLYNNMRRLIGTISRMTTTGEQEEPDDDVFAAMDNLIHQARELVGGAPPSPVQVVIDMTGGVFQGGSASASVDVIILDYDASGYGDDDQLERMRDIPQYDGTLSRAEVLTGSIMIEPKWVAKVMEAASAASEGNACRHCGEDLGGFHQAGGPCVHCNGIN